MVTRWFDCVKEPPLRAGWYDFRVNESALASRCWFDGAWHLLKPGTSGFDSRVYFGLRSQWRGALDQPSPQARPLRAP